MQWGARHSTMTGRSAFALAVAAWPLPTAAVVARHHSLAWLATAAWFAFVVVGTLALWLVTMGPRARGAHAAAGRAPALLSRAAVMTEDRIAHVSEEPDAQAGDETAAGAYAAEAAAAEEMPRPSRPPVFFASWDHEVTDPTSGFPPGEPVEVTVGLARLEAFANSGRPPRR